MPNRMLRDWTDSQKFDGISAESERLFLRLIMKADDFGRYYGDTRLIRAHCFPLLDNLRPNDLNRLLDDLSNRQLILRYEVQGRKFLAIVNYGQRLRSSRAKFPPPTEEDNGFLPTDSNFPRPAAASGYFQPEEKGIEGEEEQNCASAFELFWAAYPKKVGKRESQIKWKQLKPDIEQCVRAIEHQKKTEQWRKDGGQFIPHPATWLHQGRWDDAPKVELGKRRVPISSIDPAGWAEWRDETYPNADKLPYSQATRDIQKEFDQAAALEFSAMKKTIA